MQFNQAVIGGGWNGRVESYNDTQTLHTMVKNLYEESGYQLPQTVYWNLRGNTTNSPVQYDTNNTALISGFSPSVLNTVLDGKLPNPRDVVDRIINHPSYERITLPTSEHTNTNSTYSKTNLLSSAAN